MRIFLFLLMTGRLVYGQTKIESFDRWYLCRGDHPRCSQTDYHPYQFSERNVGDFAVFSEVLPPGPQLANHQTLLAEIISQRTDSNAVALWGDAAATADNSRVWGGFFSARSGTYRSRPPNDVQLRGLEVDVLNDTKPGRAPNHSKVGVEIVGFGNLNTAALAFLAEHKGRDGGRFLNLLMVAEDTISPDGTLMGVSPQHARIGINLHGSQFTDSAMLLSPNNKIVFREDGKLDAAIYRDRSKGGHLVLTAAPNGLRVTNAENNRNLLFLRPDGSIDHASLVWQFYRPWICGGAAIGCLLILAVAYLLREVHRLRAAIYPQPRPHPLAHPAWERT